MSLTNPNTPISEQDLHDFYNIIKPYLGTDEMPSGDMDEIINPIPGFTQRGIVKFDKANMFSLSEKVVGCWTDGKPLYQKTIVTTMPVVTTTGTFVTKEISTNIDNPDMVFVAHAFCTNNVYPASSTYTHSLTYLTNGGNQAKVRTARTTIQLLSNDVSYNSADAYVTIRYTKTTDAVNSFNYADENEYSTDEKVIGIWIDGKPIYQRTVVMAMPTCIEIGTSYWSGTNTLDVTDINISQIVSLNAVHAGDLIVNVTGYLGYGGSMASAQYEGLNCIQSWYNKDTLYVRRYTPSANTDAGVDVYVTIQYTKTTD